MWHLTDASGSIGCSTAKPFAAERAKLVIGARRDAELASLVAEIEADDGMLSLWRGTFAQKLTQRTIVAFPSATPVRDPGTADPRRLLVICAPQHTGVLCAAAPTAKPAT
jgi:NAD(P)-dependent dehydrogenase (short-subunit alcohol dehydrogenase family)